MINSVNKQNTGVKDLLSHYKGLIPEPNKQFEYFYERTKT